MSFPTDRVEIDLTTKGARGATGTVTPEVTALANAASDSAATATTEAGIATTQAGIATTEAGVATTQAGIATTQAGIATTQAGISTAQAALSSSSYNAIAAAILPGNLNNATVNAASRAVLSGLSTALPAYLTETGREGTFVFDSSNLSAKVSADTAQGIYVAPSSDATGAHGAWVRRYKGPLYIEWFGGKADSGVTDNKTAWDALRSLTGGNCDVYFDNRLGYYAFSQMVFSQGMNVRMATRQQVGIMITGDGGGAYAEGVNGGVQMFVNGCSIRNGYLSFNNPALQCLLNISNPASIGRINIEDLDLVPTGVSATQMQCTAVVLGGLTEFVWKGGQIGPGFMQDFAQVGYLNDCEFNNVTPQAHALDVANGVFHTAYPQFQLTLSSQSLQFTNCEFEQGPNGIACAGQGAVGILDTYMSDAALAKMWLPSDAVTAGELRFPSVKITGNTTSGSNQLTSLSATTALFKGMRIKIPGAGAAGGVLSTSIASISGTTVTMNDNAAATLTTTGVYYGAYLGHGYIAKTSGTTGTTVPTFPTTFQAEVADNTTTWKEHGSCAWIDATPPSGITGKYSITIRGGNIGGACCGVLARRVGGSIPQNVTVDGTTFTGTAWAGQFDGIPATIARGVNLNGYIDRGFEYLGTAGSSFTHLIEASSTLNNTNSCDFVVSTNNTNVAGRHFGSTVLTGIGAARFSNESTFLGTISITYAGALTTTAGGIGYSTGAGGTVTQATSKATGVTLNKPCGAITMNAAALAAGAVVSFTLTNSLIGADDELVVRLKSGFATPATYRAWAEGNAAGSRTIVLQNISGGSLSEAVVLGFALIKSASA